MVPHNAAFSYPAVHPKVVLYNQDRRAAAFLADPYVERPTQQHHLKRDGGTMGNLQDERAEEKHRVAQGRIQVGVEGGGGGGRPDTTRKGCLRTF